MAKWHRREHGTDRRGTSFAGNNGPAKGRWWLLLALAGAQRVAKDEQVIS